MIEDLRRNMFGDVKNENQAVSEKIRNILTTNGLVPNDSYVNKIVELYEQLENRQNVILLGPSFSGKTKALQVGAHVLIHIF